MALSSLFAQVPQAFSYQAIVRDAAGGLVINSPVNLKFSILKDSATGPSVYEETQTDSTDGRGLISVAVGSGTVVSGSFSSINWGDGVFYLKRETDPSGGSAYTISGVSQLLSVPYAFVAAKVAEAPHASYAAGTHVSVSLTGDTLYVGTGSVILKGISRATYPPPAKVICPGKNPTAVVEVTSSTGRVWMDRNLGASRAATSMDDTASFGDLYQWGRFPDGHQCRTSDTTSIRANTPLPLKGNSWDGKFIIDASVSKADWLSPQNEELWQGDYGGFTNPCPDGFYVPTLADFQAENSAYGISAGGYAQAAYDSPMKFPLPGQRNTIGTVAYEGQYGNYWSSTAAANEAPSLNLGPTSSDLARNDRAFGLSVRCIKTE